MKHYLFLIACLGLGRAATAQTAAAHTLAAPDSLHQQQELDAWMAPVKHQFDSTRDAWGAYEQHHFDTVTRKFDTTGLAVVQAFTTGLHHKEHLRLNEFARLHPGYLVSLEALRRSMIPVVDDIDITKKLYTALDPAVRASAAGRELGELIDKRWAVGIGRPAPDFSAPDTLGHLLSLSSFRGKYVLLDFWASWCGPCRQENPVVVAAYTKYHNRNFEVLSVSLDMPGKKASWLEAIRHDGMPWQHVSDLLFWKSPIVRLYAIQSIPQNFLIDPNGKIVAENLRGEALGRMLEKVL